jgi:hypothetical protein
VFEHRGFWRGKWGKDLGTETPFVGIGSHLPLSRCHFKVYHGFRRFCQGLRLLLLGFYPGPFDERFAAQGLAAVGGAADSRDQRGLLSASVPV